MNDKYIGNYKIVRELGAGAMGAVYEGLDVMVERRVAIKMLRAEIARQPDLIERFRAEAVTLARLNHPSIAMLYNFFREGEDYYMVMEFVAGKTLEAILQESGRLAPQTASDILQQALDGMAHAHRMGVLHRDIKPANIMVGADGQVKVTDFGIARVLGSSRMTREGRIIGTLEYIAPERIKGEEADIRSDLYSAGVVLFEALAGKLPFASETDYALMRAHVEQPPPMLSELGVARPPEMEAVLRKALAKSPADRYQTAEEFRDALAGAVTASPGLKATRLAAAAPVSSPRPTPVLPPTRLDAPLAPAATRPPAWKKLPMKWVAPAAAAVLVGAVALIWAFGRHTAPPQQVAAVTAPPPVVQPVAPPPQDTPSLPPAVVEAANTTPGPAIEKGKSLEDILKGPGKTYPNKPVETAAAKNPPPDRQRAAAAQPVEPAKVEPPKAPEPAPAVPPGPVETAAARPPTPAPIVRTAPTPAPPEVSSRQTPQSIRFVRYLYIEKMPNDLDGYIRAELPRQMPGRFVLVLRKEEAEAVMRGVAEDRSSSAGRVSGDLGLKNKVTGAVTVTDVDGTRQLWASEAGDKTPVIGLVRGGGAKKVAERLVSNLRKAMDGR